MFAAEADSESVCQGGPHDQYTTNLTCEGKCDGSQSCPPVSILLKNSTHSGWKKKLNALFSRVIWPFLDIHELNIQIRAFK